MSLKLLFPLVNGLENLYHDTEIRLRIASRIGVDSFPTYLYQGIPDHHPENKRYH